MDVVLNQKTINRWIYEAEPHQFVLPPTCDVCGESKVTEVVSRGIDRGRMYIVRHSNPGFDPSAALAFCEECWPRWLMWRARMGFDLHWEHSYGAACHAGCLARQGGRRTQLLAQMSMLTSRTDGFFAQKSIDGMPAINGSPLLMAMRMSHFLYRMLQRQAYYESIGDPTEVQSQLLRAFQLSEIIGVPRAQTDGILIIVEAFESWYKAPGGDVGMPKPGDKSIGLHCVHLTHYSDSGAILGFWNSWGSGWGKRGHGTISFEYLEMYFYEAFVTRRARFGPAAWNFASPPDDMTRQDLRGRLMLQTWRQRIRKRGLHGENWVVEVYETPSPTTGRRVLCAEVQNGFGLRLGWAFLRDHHGPDGHVLEITELFVWPTFRRMGIGRFLEDVAVDYAAAWGCGELHLMMNEADAVVGPPRAAARLFAQALGYQWRWRNEVAPRRMATAIKSVSRAST
jgi:GNAT superfamily N-acetyltransferase